MTDQKDQSTVSDRRSFLKLSTLGVAAAGAAAVVSTPDAAEAGEPEGTGYRETEHVKTYYDTARF